MDTTTMKICAEAKAEQERYALGALVRELTLLAQTGKIPTWDERCKKKWTEMEMEYLSAESKLESAVEEISDLRKLIATMIDRLQRA